MDPEASVPLKEGPVAQAKLVHSDDISWTKNPKYVDTWFRRLVTSDNLSTSLIRIEPGGGQVPHVHPNDIEEVTYALEGEGDVLISGAWQKCAPGDCLYVGPGLEHCVKNPGPGRLWLLTTFHPPLS